MSSAGDSGVRVNRFVDHIRSIPFDEFSSFFTLTYRDIPRDIRIVNVATDPYPAIRSSRRSKDSAGQKHVFHGSSDAELPGRGDTSA